MPTTIGTSIGHHVKIFGRWVCDRYAGPLQPILEQDVPAYIAQKFTNALYQRRPPSELLPIEFFVQSDSYLGKPLLTFHIGAGGPVLFDLAWIENNEAVNLVERQAAYAAVTKAMMRAFHAMDYDSMIEHLSMYLWDGETDDDAAFESIIYNYGEEPEDPILPSHVAAKIPDFMKPVRKKTRLTPQLAKLIADLEAATDAIKPSDGENGTISLSDYLYNTEEFMDCATEPPLCLLPLEIFQQELDQVYQHAMENGVMSVITAFPASTSDEIDRAVAAFHLYQKVIEAAEAILTLY